MVRPAQALDWLLASSLSPTLPQATNSVATRRSSTGFAGCDALLEAGLGDWVLFSTSPGYEQRIQSWWAWNSWKHPWCLFQPHNASEVSTGLTALLGAGDGAGDWHIAVRSGGHNVATANNIDDGVTIDLGHLNQTTYDKKTNLASIGPGAKWWKVYAALQEHDVLVTGGRDGDVGVGGFTLGGGSTYYMNKEGFACDSVKNYEVVLANGTIVNANKDQNADLWRALKGGGSNFGIVTRFDMEALPNTELAYGVKYMSSNHTQRLIDITVEFTKRSHEFPDDALVLFFSHNASKASTIPAMADIAGAVIYVNTEGKQNSSAFEKLAKIPSNGIPQASNVQMKASLAAAAFGSQVQAGFWKAGTSITFKNDNRTIAYAEKLHRAYVQTLNKEIGARNYETMMFYQPIPKIFGEISSKKGGNMLGLEQQQHDAILFTGSVIVHTTTKDLSIAQSRLATMTAKIQEYAALLSGSNRLIYMNYASQAQDVLGSYGRKNLEHIRRVAEKYDPAGAFQNRVIGGFKVAKVSS